MSDIKAIQLANLAEVLKPGSGISWTLYEGYDVDDSTIIANHVRSFFMSGTPMPVYGRNVVIDILSMSSEYDDVRRVFKIEIEGVVSKNEVVE